METRATRTISSRSSLKIFCSSNTSDQQFNRGQRLRDSSKRNPPEMATVLVWEAVHIAANATVRTGSLIKNTAPFQQLWPGPKWNRTVVVKGEQRKPQSRGYNAIRTVHKVIFSSHISKPLLNFQKVSPFRKETDTHLHYILWVRHSRKCTACRLIQILLTNTGLWILSVLSIPRLPHSPHHGKPRGQRQSPPTE